MTADEALFVPDGERFISTELTRGPWTPQAQHGGPPAALLARAIEHTHGAHGMMVVRLTVELLRPVPVVPLVVTARVVRPGRKVQLVEASMRANDVEVARATALRIRTADLPVPETTDAASAPPPPPEAGSSSLPPWGAAIAYRSFHRD